MVTNVFGSIGKLISRIAEEIAPMLFYLARARRVLKRAYAAQEPIETESYLGLDNDEIKSLFDQDRARAVALDEKTFKFSLALTAAFVILGTLSPLLLDRFTSQPLKALCASLIALTVVYAISSGFVALGSMRAQRVYGIGPLGNLKEATGARRRELAVSLGRNQVVGYARQLRNETSYQLLRNGLICLSAATATYVSALAIGHATLSQPKDPAVITTSRNQGCTHPWFRPQPSLPLLKPINFRQSLLHNQ